MAIDAARANFLLLASRVSDANLAEATKLLSKLVHPSMVSSRALGRRNLHNVLPYGLLGEVLQFVGCGDLWTSLSSVSRNLRDAVASTGVQPVVVIREAEDLLAFAWQASKSISTGHAIVSIKPRKSWNGSFRSASGLPVCRSVARLSLHCAQGCLSAKRLQKLWHIFPNISALELHDIRNLNAGRIVEFSHLQLLEFSATNCRAESQHYSLKLSGKELPTTLQKLRLVHVDVNWEEQGSLLNQNLMDLRQIHIEFNPNWLWRLPPWMDLAALQLVQSLPNLESFCMGDLKASVQATITQLLGSRV